MKGHVISLSSIAELREISEESIGAMVSINELAEHESTHPVLAKAADSIASVMIRRSGTVGEYMPGYWCYWINQSETWRESIDWCHKCDCGTGADCRVIPSKTRCALQPIKWLAPVLMCLGATIHQHHPRKALHATM